MATTTNKPNDWLTTKELMVYVTTQGRHWGRTYIQYLVANEKLPSFKIGSTRIFIESDVKQFINSLTRKGPPLMKKSLVG